MSQIRGAVCVVTKIQPSFFVMMLELLLQWVVKETSRITA